MRAGMAVEETNRTWPLFDLHHCTLNRSAQRSLFINQTSFGEDLSFMKRKNVIAAMLSKYRVGSLGFTNHKKGAPKLHERIIHKFHTNSG
jgi:hypothetical protein